MYGLFKCQLQLWNFVCRYQWKRNETRKKTYVVYIFKCHCENSNIKNFFGSHESFGFGPIALIVETKSWRWISYITVNATKNGDDDLSIPNVWKWINGFWQTSQKAISKLDKKRIERYHSREINKISIIWKNPNTKKGFYFLIIQRPF